MTDKIKEQVNMVCSRKRTEVSDTASSNKSNEQKDATTKSASNVLTGHTSWGKGISKNIVQSTMIGGMMWLYYHWTNSTERHNKENTSWTVEDQRNLFGGFVLFLIICLGFKGFVLLEHRREHVKNGTPYTGESNRSHDIQAIHNVERGRGSEKTTKNFLERLSTIKSRICTTRDNSEDMKKCTIATSAWSTGKCQITAHNENTVKCQKPNESENIFNCHKPCDTGYTEKCNVTTVTRNTKIYQERESIDETIKCYGTADTWKTVYGTADYRENEEINKRTSTGIIRKHHTATSFTEEHLIITDTGSEEETNAYSVPRNTKVHISGTKHTNDECGALVTRTRDENHEHGITLNETERYLDTSIVNEYSEESCDHFAHYAINTNESEGLCKEADYVNFKGKSDERIHDLKLRSNNIQGINTSTSNTTNESDIQNVIKHVGASPLPDNVRMSDSMTIIYQTVKEGISDITTLSVSISNVDNQNDNTTGSNDDLEEETLVKTLFVDTLNEFADLDNTFLSDGSDDSDVESLDEYITENNDCCTSENIDIYDSFSSSSITTSDEIPANICQKHVEDRRIEIEEGVSYFFESEIEGKRPAKTPDSFSKHCTLQETQSINGQGMDVIPMHSYDDTKKLRSIARSTTYMSFPSKKKKAVVPSFDERKVWITFFVSNHFNRHNQIQYVFSRQRLRAATLITQDLSNLWGRTQTQFPFPQQERNEAQTFNHSPNVETVSYETQISGAIGHPETGRISRDSEITEITSDVFNKICNCSVTESMRYEWGRLKSFWSFPMDCPILPTVLAKYGFYYTGNRDEVVCFTCHISHSNWNRGDSVYAVHYQISRRCRFMNGEDVGNVPIHGPLSCLSRRAGGTDGASVATAEEIELRSMLSTPETVASLLLQHNNANQVEGPKRGGPSPQVEGSQAENSDTLHVGDNPGEMSNNTECGGGSKFSLTGFQAAVPSNGTSISQVAAAAAAAVSQESTMTLPGPDQTTSASKPTCLQTNASTTPQTSKGLHTATANTATPATNRLLTSTNASQTSSQEVHASTSSQAPTVQTNVQQQLLNQQHPTTFAQRQQHRRQEQQNQREQHVQEQGQVGPAMANGAATNLNNLGVTTAKPRYPNYAALAVRSGTFNGFPNHLDQTPIQMAKAGFFYAGYGDYVRCFFCGGGLRNWEPGDDPWVEHARWFPRCAYVKQNRGQTYINLVLQRQRELTLPNEYVNTTREASSIANSQAQTTRMQANTDRQSNDSNERSNTQNGTSTNTLTNEQNSTASVFNEPARNSDQVARQTNATADEMNSPAVLSVKNLGYGERIIQNALQHFRNTHGSVNLTALALLEIIFGFNDNPPETPDQTQTCSQSAEGPQIRRETNNTENKIKEPQAGAAATAAGATAATSQHLITKNKLKGDRPAHSYTEEELKSIQEENSQLKEQMKCKICMDNSVCISFLPCGHLCCCAECAPAMVKCPICRQIIRGSVKTYLS